MLWFESNGSHRHRRVALPDSAPGADRRALRASLAARRRRLTPQERAQAAHQVARNVERALPLKAGSRIALYAALPSELDTTPLIELARRRGCRIYLPRIDRQRAARGMRFLEMSGALGATGWGSMSRTTPRVSGHAGWTWCSCRWWALTATGCASARGGGFYDRAFAFRRWRASWHAPQLIGLGYAFQQLERIVPAAHDVRMDAVITDEGIIRCTTG